MYPSTLSLFSSAVENMLQPLALLTVLAIIVFVQPRSAQMWRSLRAFLLGLGTVYALQLITGLLPPLWLRTLYTFLLSAALLILVGLGLWLTYRYARARRVAMPEQVVRPMTWLEDQRRKRTLPGWLLLSSGILVGLAEPLFYGYQQHLLTIELQTSISLLAIFLALTQIVITLAPLVACAWLVAVSVSQLTKTERLLADLRTALPLLGAGVLILVAWTVFLSGHSFI